MKTTGHSSVALIATATGAATIALSATAHASPDGSFQSPSGNFVCIMMVKASTGSSAAACQAQHHTYAPPPPGQCHLGGWGSQFNLDEGNSPHFECVGGVLAVPPMPTLDYGQTRSVGTITCESQQSGVRCTDSSSGHFFRLSSDTYELG